MGRLPRRSALLLLAAVCSSVVAAAPAAPAAPAARADTATGVVAAAYPALVQDGRYRLARVEPDAWSAFTDVVQTDLMSDGVTTVPVLVTRPRPTLLSVQPVRMQWTEHSTCAPGRICACNGGYRRWVFRYRVTGPSGETVAVARNVRQSYLGVEPGMPEDVR